MFTNGTYWFHWMRNDFDFDSEVTKGRTNSGGFNMVFMVRGRNVNDVMGSIGFESNQRRIPADIIFIYLVIPFGNICVYTLPIQ